MIVASCDCFGSLAFRTGVETRVVGVAAVKENHCNQ